MAGVVRLHPALARVVVQVSQLPDALLSAEVDDYLHLIRDPAQSGRATEPTSEPERIAG